MVVVVIEGRVRAMKLGWHLIGNPGQQDLCDPAVTRDDLEADFFQTEAPWSSIDKNKVGVDILRVWLKDVLSLLVKREFPKVLPPLFIVRHVVTDRIQVKVGI